MFGKLTRSEYEWHPHRVLCRRFNLPDPFPAVGTCDCNNCTVVINVINVTVDDSCGDDSCVVCDSSCCENVVTNVLNV